MEKELKYYLFNVYSSYSFYDSLVTEEKLVKSLNKYNYSGCALSDENSIKGVCSFSYIFKNNNLKFITASKVNLKFNDYVIETTLVVLNEDGYYNLVHILNNVINNDNKIIDYETIKYKINGLAFILSSQSLFDLGDDDVLSVFRAIKNEVFLGSEVYSKEDLNLIERLYNLCDNNSIKVIVNPKVKYILSSEKDTYKILKAIGSEKYIDDIYILENFHLLTIETLKKFYRAKDLINNFELGEKCNFDISSIKGRLISFTKENEISLSDDDYLTKCCFDSLKEKNLDSIQDYLDRLNEELAVIKKMGFSSYFLLVSDYVNYAKSIGIKVGPGRGSASGCLVSYLLNIISVNPIVFNLSFSRFLNEYRHDMPDIDIDIEDTRRNEVIQYLKDKYGANRVCNIITYSTFKPRSAIRSVGKVLNYSDDEINLISKTISDNAKDFNTEIKTNIAFKNLCKDDKVVSFIKTCNAILTLPNNTSFHASGIIVNDTDISLLLPVLNTERGIVMFEYQYLEKMNFLKLDILGLSNLHFLGEIEKSILEVYNTKIDYSKIPLDDKKTFDLINNLMLTNIFQLSSFGMRKAINQTKINNFMELSNLTALYRPGPMDSIPTYAKQKQNEYTNNEITDLLIPILKETYGIIIYQEQIIEICSKIGKLNPSEADLFRRAMSKKDISKMELYKDKFINNSINISHLSEYNAIKLFRLIEKFSEFGFNKSHSVSYSFIIYYLCYFKANYPLSFFKVSFDLESIGDNFYQLIEELKYFNIKLKNPDVNFSQNEFTIVDNDIYMPLTRIKNINANVISHILEEQKNKKFESISDFLFRFLPNDNLFEKDFEALVNSGALDRFNVNRTTLFKNKEIIKMQYENIIDSNENLVDFVKYRDDFIELFLREISSIGFSNSIKLNSLFIEKSKKYYLTFDKVQKKDDLYYLHVRNEYKTFYIKFRKFKNVNVYSIVSFTSKRYDAVKRDFIYDEVVIEKEN